MNVTATSAPGTLAAGAAAGAGAGAGAGAAACGDCAGEDAELLNWHVTGRPCALIVSITCLYGMPTTEVAPTAISVSPGFSCGWPVACVPGLMPMTSTAPVALFGVNLRPREPGWVNVTAIPSDCSSSSSSSSPSSAKVAICSKLSAASAASASARARSSSTDIPRRFIFASRSTRSFPRALPILAGRFGRGVSPPPRVSR